MERQFEWSHVDADLWYYYEKATVNEESEGRLLRGIIEVQSEPIAYRAMLYLPFPDENTSGDLESAKLWLEEAAATAHFG